MKLQTRVRWKKAAVVVAASLIAAGATVLAATSALAAPAEFPVGKPAPAFTLKKLDGKSLSLSQLKGKVVFLDFWMPG